MTNFATTLTRRLITRRLVATTGLLGLAALPGLAAPVPAAHLNSVVPNSGAPFLFLQAAAKPKAVHAAAQGSPDDVTLDFVAADINDVLKALAMQTHTNIVSGSDVKGTITVSLAHVSLEEALDLISKLSGFQYAKVGHTYLVGTPAAISALTTEGTATAPSTTGVITFSYSDPADLTNDIKMNYPNVKTSTGKATGGQAGGGVLIVTGTPEDVDAVRRMVAETEASLSRNIGASRTEIYKIKYAAPDDLETVLSRLVPGVIITPGPTQRAVVQAPSTADAGGATSTTTSYGAQGGTVTATAGNVATKPTTGSLLLTGSDADIARAETILTEIDTRPAQLNYDAKIAEINLTGQHNIGLTYDFSGATTTIGEEPPIFVPDATGKLTQATPTTTPDPYPGSPWKLRTFGRGFITNLVTVGLDALFQNGDAKLLSDPNISAIDGQQAAVFVGDSITYVSSVTTGPTGQNITTATVSAGIKLFVTGKVNNDGYITLNVHPEVSTPTFQPSIGGAVLPDISTREATTTLRVKDGDTIAIGGLISQTDVKNINKVPFLGDLPFFGSLFRDTKTTHNRDEVVIFIKVSIAKDAP